MKIKRGVKVSNLSREIYLVWGWMERWFASRGLKCVVTSASEGRHSPNSLHPSGEALDFRTRNLGPMEMSLLEKLLKETFDKCFDIVLEKDHIHVEFDPRGESLFEEVE